MSIYDMPANDSSKSGKEASDSVFLADDAAVTSPAELVREADPQPHDAEGRNRTKRRRLGCGSCSLGCLGMLAVLAAAAGIGGWFAWSQWPAFARSAVVAAIEESDLSATDQEEVIAQIDRVLDGYQAGEVTLDQVFAVAERFAESPLFTLMMADAAHELYVKPSGLTDAEKELADRTLARVARGVFDERIEQESLEGPLDFISSRDFNGERKLKESVPDDDLRTMLSQCKQIADAARVPHKGAHLDLGEEFKRVVDEVISPSS